MEKRDNYAIQAQLAKQRFLTYDQEKLIKKFQLLHDEDYLYLTFLGSPHRLSRKTGDLEREEKGSWCSANSFNEILTLFDILCDSRDFRFLTGRWQPMHHFGHLFHQGLTEDSKSCLAEAFDRDEAALRRACEALGAHPISGGDYGCAVELFDKLPIAMMFWHGDEEFSPRMRYYWDANSLMYLRYETMYYAVGLLDRRLRELISASS